MTVHKIEQVSQPRQHILSLESPVQVNQCHSYEVVYSVGCVEEDGFTQVCHWDRTRIETLVHGQVKLVKKLIDFGGVPTPVYTKGLDGSGEFLTVEDEVWTCWLGEGAEEALNRLASLIGWDHKIIKEEGCDLNIASEEGLSQSGVGHKGVSFRFWG